jgi:nucleotide-binding universal stress UspA family protein
MTYAALLVPVDAEPVIDPRLTFAVALANQFEARLIGVGAEIWRVMALGGEFDGGYGAGMMVAAETDRVEADLKRAETKFRHAGASVRQGADWRSAVGFPVAEIAAEARCADLIVTSHRVRDGRSDDDVAAPGALVLQAGRPVLFTPAGADRLELRSVVVAWKDTRESRRAVADALPLLKRATSVVLSEVCYHEQAAAARARLADVAGYLLRHGVHASATVCVEEKDVHSADQFLAFADQHEADLIVAGAYGHSRLAERVFGGFTKALLAHTSRAVMLSH